MKAVRVITPLAARALACSRAGPATSAWQVTGGR